MDCASNYILFKKHNKEDEKEQEDKWEVHSDELNKSFNSDDE